MKQQAKAPRVPRLCREHEQLLTAIEADDLPRVQALIKRDTTHLIIRDPNNGTLLHHAVWAGAFAVVQFLLNKGMEVDARDLGGMTPLLFAVLLQRKSPGVAATIDVLLDAGAAVYVGDHDGCTPLHYAIANVDRPHYLLHLLEHGADVCCREFLAGWSPLHFAAQSGHIGALKVLLPAAQDANVRDLKGRTPRGVAAEYGRAAAEAMLTQYGGVR